MKRVYKFPFEINDHVELTLPGADPEPLVVQVQYDVPCLWALIDADGSGVYSTKVRLRIAGTGDDIRDIELTDPYARNAYKYLNTFQMHDGALVFHVWWQFRVNGA